MKSFKYLLLVVSFFTFFTVARADNPFTFMSEPQSIAVNDKSKEIKIQYGDPAGLSETYYLSFESTSPTGQFLNSSGNQITATSTTTMNLHSVTRGSIYYRDSTTGNYVLTINLSNKSKSLSYSINQSISVGSVDLESNVDNATTTEQTATTTTPSNQTNTIVYVYSAHSSPEPLSNTEEKIEFEISAGRDRLTSVGNSLIFRAVPTKFQNIPESGITYHWSFGDGTTATGNNVNHTYKFAGDYAVVVNANYSDKQAVSRMQVRVISPNTTITKIPEGVEILNNSNAEINLEGWSLVSPKKTFIFPADTLIPSGKKVIFADSVTGMMEDTIQLINPIGKEFGFIKTETKEQPKVDLTDIQAKIEEVGKSIAQISKENNVGMGLTPEQQVTVSQEDITVSDITNSSTTETGAGTENVAQVFEAQQKVGLVSRLFAWPIKGFNFIRRLFVEE